jgi:hypothetical protein
LHAETHPAYPLELFQRVITVSLRTIEIVRGLPKLEVLMRPSIGHNDLVDNS